MDAELIAKICALLQEAHAQMLQLEQQTNALYTCKLDDVADCVAKRVACLEQVDAGFREIDAICEQDPTGTLTKAVGNHTDFDALPEEVRCIQEARQQLNAVIYRILNIEPQIKERLTLERDRLLEKIRENNRGQGANASKFYDSVAASGQELFFSEKDKRI